LSSAFGRLGARHVVAVAALAILAIGCGGEPAGTPVATPAVTLDIAAVNIQFDRSVLTAPADKPFAIWFANRESAPHNMSIQGNGDLFVGEIFSGPAERIYQVQPLPAGEYRFVCDLHPTMTGTLITE
jgi:plastocyanin